MPRFDACLSDNIRPAGPRTCRPQLETASEVETGRCRSPVPRLRAALAPPDACGAGRHAREATDAVGGYQTGRRRSRHARGESCARQLRRRQRACPKVAGFARSRAPQRSCRTGDGRGRHEREAPALWERARGLAGPLFGLRAGPRPDARPHAGRTRRRDIKKRV